MVQLPEDVTRAAVFLDRDGVICPDSGLVERGMYVTPYPETAGAIRRLNEAGLLVVVVTNQAVVARGTASCCDVEAVHRNLAEQLLQGGAKIDAFYYCPHHPNANLKEYRMNCSCRKPGSGMLEQAAAEHHIDLKRSFIVGDRISDIQAGQHVGCQAILVMTGMHEEPLIESSLTVQGVTPDFGCESLDIAVDWILTHRKDVG